MVAKHLGRHLTQEQRSRWMQRLFESADTIGLPADPEFRSALVAYFEWGSRLAVSNSQDGATVDQEAPMPNGVGTFQGDRNVRINEKCLTAVD